MNIPEGDRCTDCPFLRKIYLSTSYGWHPTVDSCYKSFCLLLGIKLGDYSPCCFKSYKCNYQKHFFKAMQNLLPELLYKRYVNRYFFEGTEECKVQELKDNEWKTRLKNYKFEFGYKY